MKYTKGYKNKKGKETRKKPTKTQTTTENPIKPGKNQSKDSLNIITSQQSPLAFAPSRTKTLSIIIDIALKVMKISIPFNLRNGDRDLKVLPLNHLSHNIKNPFLFPQNKSLQLEGTT
jgi:hypothetical protein